MTAETDLMLVYKAIKPYTKKTQPARFWINYKLKGIYKNRRATKLKCEYHTYISKGNKIPK